LATTYRATHTVPDCAFDGFADGDSVVARRRWRP
jgi:hypothetical protein